MGINEPIRVLHISYGSGTFGGAARFSMNYFRNIDQKDVIFDFLFCNKKSFGLIENDSILDQSRIFELNCFDKSIKLRGYFRVAARLVTFLKRERYEIIHINTGGQPVQLACLVACCLSKVPVRIAHSHSSGDYSKKSSLKTRIKDIVKPVNRALVRVMATDYFACSLVAGRYMFGEKGVQSTSFKIVTNAIDLSNYIYDQKLREKIRNVHGINEGTLVFGHVGRFDKAKNHMFLLDVFDSICEKRKDCVLWIVGDGDLKEKIISRVNQSKNKDKIFLLGEKKNVNDYMQGMDALIFPSIYEGLSIVTIEAQCSGLPVFASSNITKEHNVSGNVKFIKLDQSPEAWAKGILNEMNDYTRRSCEKKLTENGYNINVEAKKLKKYYLKKHQEIKKC